MDWEISGPDAKFIFLMLTYSMCNVRNGESFEALLKREIAMNQNFIHVLIGNPREQRHRNTVFSESNNAL